MAKLAKNIVDFCGTVAPYSYVFAIVTVLVVGIMFAIPMISYMKKQRATVVGLLLEQHLLLDA